MIAVIVALLTAITLVVCWRYRQRDLQRVAGSPLHPGISPCAVRCCSFFLIEASNGKLAPAFAYRQRLETW